MRLFLAVDLEEGGKDRSEARVHAASAVRREWIEEDLAAEVREAWFEMTGRPLPPKDPFEQG